MAHNMRNSSMIDMTEGNPTSLLFLIISSILNTGLDPLCRL